MTLDSSENLKVSIKETQEIKDSREDRMKSIFDSEFGQEGSKKMNNFKKNIDTESSSWKFSSIFENIKNIVPGSDNIEKRAYTMQYLVLSNNKNLSQIIKDILYNINDNPKSEKANESSYINLVPFFQFHQNPNEFISSIYKNSKAPDLKKRIEYFSKDFPEFIKKYRDGDINTDFKNKEIALTTKRFEENTKIESLFAIIPKEYKPFNVKFDKNYAELLKKEDESDKEAADKLISAL